jgi:hypothetical protein
MVAQVGSVAGPQVAVRAPEHAKSWFKYLVNAQSHITAGRLDDAAQSYTKLLDGFRLPVKETFDVHLALGQVWFCHTLIMFLKQCAAVAYLPAVGECKVW